MENIIADEISKNVNILRGKHSYNFVDTIAPDKLYNATQTHRFAQDDKVYLLIDLALFIRNCKVSLAVTNGGVSITSGDSITGFETKFKFWGHFDHLTIQQIDASSYISSCLNEDSTPIAYLEGGYDDCLLKALDVINEINTKIIKTVESIFDKIKQFRNEKRNKDILELLNNTMNFLFVKFHTPLRIDMMIAKTIALHDLKDYEHSLTTANMTEELLFSSFGNNLDNWGDFYKDVYANLLLHKAWANLSSDKIYPAIFDLTTSISLNTEYTDIKEEEIRMEIYEEYKESFTELPLKERKVIFVADEFFSNKPSHFLFLLNSRLPDTLKFEANHPQNNELYIAHPFKGHLYYHISKFNEMMFQDKLMELNRILQCLGAKSIRLMKRESNNELRKSIEHLKVGGSGSGLTKSAEANVKTENESNSESRSTRKIVSEQFFEPDEVPHLPKETLWFSHEVVWQKLAEQRLNGSITKSTISMSSNSSEFLTTTERKEILAEFKTLILKIKGSYESYRHLEKSVQEENEWSIEVEFVPKSELKRSPEVILPEKENQESDNNEREFTEFILDCIHDGSISEDERRLIERRRVKLNIAEERAKQIEDNLLKFGSVNESERKYLEELEFCYSSGSVISEDERRILERLRTKLQISEARAKELEERISPN